MVDVSAEVFIFIFQIEYSRGVMLTDGDTHRAIVRMVRLETMFSV